MVCIIPARGGSSRFPGKNVVNFFGRPIIHWVIEAALNTEIFDDVIVSTDDNDIAAISEDGGATVLGRPPQLCGDVPEDDVLRYTADFVGADSICRIYPFAAFLDDDRIWEGYKHFYRDDVFGVYVWEAVLEVQEYTHNPIRSMRVDRQGRIVYLSPEDIGMPTQCLEPLYHDAGTYMFCTREALDKPLWERSIKAVPIDEMDAQDIDTWQDYEMAKLKYTWSYL